MHTPTPCPHCRECHDPKRGISFDGFGINSCDLYRTRVATMHQDYHALGAYLVRCVNSHEALVEALKAARTWMDNRRHIAEYVIELALVHDALALAEGKE